MTLTRTEDSVYRVACCCVRLEINKGIVQTGFGEAVLILAIAIRIIVIVRIRIVVVTIATPKDVIHTTLNILGISCCLQYVGGCAGLRITM